MLCCLNVLNFYEVKIKVIPSKKNQYVHSSCQINAPMRDQYESCGTQCWASKWEAPLFLENVEFSLEDEVSDYASNLRKRPGCLSTEK